MFIPRGLYERAPYYWVIVGTSLMVMGTYLGATSNPGYYAAGLGGGAIASIWGLLIFRKRLLREVRRPCSTYDDYLDQTCELNYRPEPLEERLSSYPDDQA
jgi:hypothetical protein